MNDILYARYLESLNHRLNEALTHIQAELPIDQIEYDSSGKPIYKCCWPLVKIFIEIVETSKALKNGGSLPEERDDTDDRYTVDWAKVPTRGQVNR